MNEEISDEVGPEQVSKEPVISISNSSDDICRKERPLKILNRSKIIDYLEGLMDSESEISPGFKLKRQSEEDTVNCLPFELNIKITKRHKINGSFAGSMDHVSSKRGRSSIDATQKWRLNFSSIEKEAVIKYVFKRKEFSQLKGIKFWKIMERKKICPGRTWQSLKNHFLRCSVKNLASFNIPQEDLNQFKRLYRCSTPVEVTGKIFSRIPDYFPVNK